LSPTPLKKDINIVNAIDSANNYYNKEIDNFERNINLINNKEDLNADAENNNLNLNNNLIQNINGLDSGEIKNASGTGNFKKGLFFLYYFV